MARVAALVAAAGHGTRLGLGPKVALTIGGRTLLELTLAALRDVSDEIVVALPPVPVGLPVPQGVRVVSGGATRQASVRAMLGATSADFVLVHDVARPFLPVEVALGVLTAARATGAATAAVPVADTLLGPDGRELDRGGVLAIQTPQAFARVLLQEAHDAAAAAGFVGTDDAGLVRRMGRHVAVVPGSPLLLKVTRPSDLAWAEAVARRQLQGEQR